MSAFFSYLVNGLAVGCGFALLASGLVTIHRVTGVVNFAQATFAVVGGLCTGSLLSMGLPHGVAELAGVALAVAAGLLTGLAALGKPGTSPQSALIVTLGVGILAYALEIAIWGDQPSSFAGLHGSLTVAGVRIQWQYVLVIAVTAVVFGALGAFFTRTDLGKALTACASDPYAARLVGIGVVRMSLVAFALGGGLGGIAGVLLTPLQPISFDSDVALIVNGFAAAILGGLNRPGPALVGGLLLGVAEAMVAGYGNASYQTEIALVLMLTIMIWRAARTPAVHEEAAT
jgi:branched-chain amino acid transport system permease protein